MGCGRRCLPDRADGASDGRVENACPYVLDSWSRFPVWAEGRVEVIVQSLPRPGVYQTNMAVVGEQSSMACQRGAEGLLYLSQGALTNSGVIGLDSYQIGWLSGFPTPPRPPGP